MTQTRLKIGISTCPNDTFAFHALLSGVISDPQLDLDFELLDVEELNRGLAAGRFDVAKGSFHAGMHLSRELLVLPVGAALGFGDQHRESTASPRRLGSFGYFRLRDDF